MSFLMPFFGKLALHFLTAYADKIITDKRIRKRLLDVADYVAENRYRSKALKESARRQRLKLLGETK